MADSGAKNDLFGSTNCYISGNLDQKILKCLENGGATISKFTMDKATHVICGQQYDEAHVQEAMEIYDTPSVTEGWVLASVKIGRLAVVKAYDPLPNKIFSGFCFTFVGVDQQDRRRLFSMIKYSGGVVQRVFDNKVTHLVCAAALGAAYSRAMTLPKHKLSIICPDWIVECLKTKTLVDTEQYHPRLLVVPEPKLVKVLKADTPLSSIIGGFEFESSKEKDKELPNPMTGANVRMQVMRGQLQQNLRPQGTVNRSIIVQNMQPTPQQINQILQSQIAAQQQKQLEMTQQTPPSPQPQTQTITQQKSSLQAIQHQLETQQKQAQMQAHLDQLKQQQTIQNQAIASQIQPNQNPQQIHQVLSQNVQNQPIQQIAQNQSPQTITQITQVSQGNTQQMIPINPGNQQNVTQQVQQGLGQVQINQINQINQGQGQINQGQPQQFIHTQNLNQQQALNQQNMNQQQQMRVLQQNAMQQVAQQNQQQQQMQITQQQMAPQNINAQTNQQMSQNQMFTNQTNTPQMQQQKTIQTPSQDAIAQRHLMLQQQIESNRNQQIQLISQQLQNSTPSNINQSQIISQQQQFLSDVQMKANTGQGQQINNQIGLQQIQGQFTQNHNMMQAQVQQNQGQNQQNVQNQGQGQQNQGQMQQEGQGQGPSQIGQSNQQQFITQQFKQNPQQTIPGQTFINRSPQQPQQILTQNQMGGQQVILNQGQQGNIPQSPQGNNQYVQIIQGQKIIQIQGGQGQQIMQQKNLGTPQFNKIIVQQQGQGNTQIVHQQTNQQVQGDQQSQQINQMQMNQHQLQQSPQPQTMMQGQGQGQQGQGQVVSNQNIAQQQRAQQIQQLQQQMLLKNQQIGTTQIVQHKLPQGQGNQIIIQGNTQVNTQQIQQSQILQSPINNPPGTPEGLLNDPNMQIQGQIQQNVQQGVPGQQGQGNLMIQQGQSIQLSQQQGGQQMVGQQGQIINRNRPRYMYLDQQSSVQFQRMDPAQRQEYLEQLHNKQRSVMLPNNVAFQARPPGTPGIVATGPQGVANVRAPTTQHIVIRSQCPPGLNRQQQVQWLQSQGNRQIVVRPGGSAPGLSPIITQQQVGQNQATVQFQVDPNATPQQQQMQLQMQRQQHFQRLQQMQAQKAQQQAAGGTFQEGIEQNNQLLVDPNANNQMNKTKTALANMLSSRLVGNNVPIPEQSVEPSAAGTLRMMTAQHNASLNVVSGNRTPQELLVIQQQQIQQQSPQQPRRTLSNITNSSPVPPSPIVGQITPTGPVVVPQSPSSIKGTPPFSPGRAPLPRPQFYGHNPNLKLPNDLFLLGCHFLIVEYEDSHTADLPSWKKTITFHGGEIETSYNLRVTHVLCRTQKHGIVMQAIRDNKRCVTVYWLNDIILKRQVIPPWQAIHLPAPSLFGPIKPGSKHILCLMGFEDTDRQRVKHMITESGARRTSFFNRQNTAIICKKLDPNNKKYLRAKELNVPMVNLVWLSDLLLGNTSNTSQFDAAKYQVYNLPNPLRIDYTIVSHLMNAWKAPINLTQEAHEKVKRSQLEPQNVKAKRQRTLPPLENIPAEIICTKPIDPEKGQPIVLFSQVDNLVGLTKAVNALGGRVTADPKEVTHLVMTRQGRTMKFIYGLCLAKFIIKSSWLEESARAGHFVNEESHVMQEPDKDFTCDVEKVVKSPNRKALFEGKFFFITPSVRPSCAYLRNLIELCGGKVEKNRRSVAKIQEQNEQATNSYIIISCPEDLQLVGFKNFVCYVCTTELILQSIMEQAINILPHSLKYW